MKRKANLFSHTHFMTQPYINQTNFLALQLLICLLQTSWSMSGGTVFELCLKYILNPWNIRTTLWYVLEFWTRKEYVHAVVEQLFHCMCMSQKEKQTLCNLSHPLSDTPTHIHVQHLFPCLTTFDLLAMGLVDFRWPLFLSYTWNSAQNGVFESGHDAF